MVESSNLPVHSEQMISYPYGVIDSTYSCGYHTGVDIVPHGSTESNPLLYPIFDNMEVVAINLNPLNSLGVYVLLEHNGLYYRYCHMVENSLQVQVGDILTKNDVIGRMGATGNVTGIHLHLECSSTATWNCNTFQNPCVQMGIPNEDDLVLMWIPTPSPVRVKKHKFKWVLFGKNKRRY